ncbi:MAG TPA: hypothetical protein DCP97_00640, partial [Ruminococcaceae bacterium]|nr:hypothetical protein [Oscillospiraceae bacterium]
MKLVKRINLLLLCVILLLSVTACNNNTEQVKSSSQDTKINLQSFSQASKTNTKQAESQGNEDKGKMVAKSTFNFTDQCKDMQELYDKAEIVVIGTVISSTPAPMGNAAFTNYELNELKVLK